MAGRKYPLTDEQKKKLRDDFKRHPFIDEYRRKIALAKKRGSRIFDPDTIVHLDENK